MTEHWRQAPVKPKKDIGNLASTIFILLKNLLTLKTQIYCLPTTFLHGKEAK